MCTEGVEGEKPAPPVDLQAVVNDLGGVDLSWVDQADNETDYLVYRRYNDDDDINADGDFVVIAELPRQQHQLHRFGCRRLGVRDLLPG